jgi:hypothetical protein
MSAAKHTPGPWDTDTTQCGSPLACTSIAVRGPDGFPLADVTLFWPRGCFEPYPEKNELDEGEAQANARLIAAAPELLEALKLAVQAMRAPMDEWKGEVERRALDTANAAIAKATGSAS